LDFRLDIIDRVGGLHLKGDGFTYCQPHTLTRHTSQRLDENLHVCMKALVSIMGSCRVMIGGGTKRVGAYIALPMCVTRYLAERWLRSPIPYLIVRGTFRGLPEYYPSVRNTKGQSRLIQ
jgi:hypothetical protein